MRRLCAVILLLTTTLQACVSWVRQESAIQDVVATAPSRVRVHRRDASTIVLSQATIHNDSIVGTVDRVAPLGAASRERYVTSRVAVPTSDVIAIAVQRFDTSKTVLLVLVVSAVLLTLFVAATNDLGTFNWEQLTPAP